MSEARRLILLRHGQTEWNLHGRAQGHADISLDEVGRGQAEAVARRQHDGAPGQLEQGADGADNAPQGVLEAAVGDQAGRQVEQHAGLALAPLGLGPAALAARHQQADHHGDQQVDGQRQVVLGVVDDDVVVGLEEQQVEGEEAEAGGGDPRAEPAGRRRAPVPRLRELLAVEGRALEQVRELLAE